MNHLEKLTRQYYDWKGYLVKGNVKVGRLDHGGWAGELDIVAYDPQKQHLIHVEPSIDADSWPRREERFRKKFNLGKKYIYTDVFPWLGKETVLEQVAVLVSSSRKELCGAQVISIDEFMETIKNEIKSQKVMRKGAISEEYDLLRTLQMAIKGYSRVISKLP